MNTPSINSALPSGQKSENKIPIAISKISEAGAVELRETFNDVFTQMGADLSPPLTPASFVSEEIDSPAVVVDPLDFVLAAQGQEKMPHNEAISAKSAVIRDAISLFATLFSADGDAAICILI
ncbi:hypothetical protein REG_0606 [Candidatus Regiella insecticola LSR1]|uniref:Uncharacterized protein n=1 Tax=Candidatus Regiella insecticola LSR1 TaxID=663321 RepID=E0WRK2_9ENTR|nr:hypothetical protein [Candidatus Regiella insecticola]EFL92762.1 hypothetical protein REG_0606 [Candidatus Regiella insecticola LSR1]